MNNIQVDQYHEEAGGQRTVVRLGSNFSLSRLGNQNMQNDCCSLGNNFSLSLGVSKSD